MAEHLQPPEAGATVTQGRLADCGVIAAMNAVQRADPQHWTSHLQDGAETATVTLYDKARQPVPVTVDKTMPVDVNGKSVGAETSDGSAFGPLVEKAFAQELAGDSYGGLAYAYSSPEALAGLTGRDSHSSAPATVTPGEPHVVRLHAVG